MNTERLYIIIPAKDEGTRIGGVLRHLQLLNYRNVVVVNDGSRDNTGEVARSFGATVVNHLVNLGAGAATQTGIEYALSRGAEAVVTLDGDHQHLPDDVNLLVRTLHEKNVDVVIGSRFLSNNSNIPTSRVFYNKIANVITYLLTGMRVSDSQSGMKAMRADFARKSSIRRDGFEFCIEIIRYIHLHKATWCEVPISVVYTKDTMSKGQGFWTGLKMMIRLVKII